MSPSATVAAGARKGTLTRDQVIEKIIRWDALYGEPPCTADWNPSLARWRAQEWRIERYYEGDPETGQPWPALNTAKRLFEGSFDAAVRAAGLVPHRPGPRRRPAGGALPAIEQRAPRAPRDVEEELTAAAERVLEAERRAARAEERTQRALVRADRAEERVAEVRARADGRVAEARERATEAARRAAERSRGPSPEAVAAERAARAAERRAEAAEDAVREAEARAESLERALAVAESEVQAVRAQVTAGTSVNGHARAAEQRAVALVSATAARRAEQVLAARQAEADRDRAIARAEAAERRIRELSGGARTLADVSALRGGTGPVGPGPVAEALRALAVARAGSDRTALHDALTRVASEAVRWRERL
jgi:hypothetical protein